jgi:hypothetical protein
LTGQTEALVAKAKVESQRRRFHGGLSTGPRTAEGEAARTACTRASSRLTTKRLRVARFPEQDVDILAAGNLWVRGDEMVAVRF